MLSLGRLVSSATRPCRTRCRRPTSLTASPNLTPSSLASARGDQGVPARAELLHDEPRPQQKLDTGCARDVAREWPRGSGGHTNLNLFVTPAAPVAADGGMIRVAALGSMWIDDVVVKVYNHAWHRSF